MKLHPKAWKHEYITFLWPQKYTFDTLEQDTCIPSQSGAWSRQQLQWADGEVIGALVKIQASHKNQVWPASAFIGAWHSLVCAHIKSVSSSVFILPSVSTLHTFLSCKATTDRLSGNSMVYSPSQGPYLTSIYKHHFSKQGKVKVLPNILGYLFSLQWSEKSPFLKISL